MAGRRKKKSFRKKRKVRKRSLARMRPGAPSKMFLKFRYSDSFELNTTGIAPAVQVYSLNGMFDPDVTGVGAQPRYFDEYIGIDAGSAIYNHYTVLGAHVKVEAYNQDTNSVAQRLYCAVRDTSGTATLSSYEESSQVVKRLLGRSSSGSATTTMNLNWSAKKWFGKKNVTTERDLEGSSTTNPSEQAFLHIATTNPWADDPAACQIVVTIDYIALCRTLVQPGQS